MMTVSLDRFAKEAESRFKLTRLSEKLNDKKLTEIARRYIDTFLADPDVAEKYKDEASLIREAVLHSYHAGIIVALYEATEEDYEIGEKTYAVLTNMDTVFFSGLMFTRWNVKKRCVSYKTDAVAESLWQVADYLFPGLRAEDPALRELLLYIFCAGAAADIETMHDPYIDLDGIE